MAEAVVHPRTRAQVFFCHRCNVEYEDVLQDFTCPFCSSGFVERLEHDETMEEAEYSDPETSILDDASNMDDSIEDSNDPTEANAVSGQPLLNDLAFLMTGGRLRAGVGARRSEGRSLLEQLVWMIGGGRGGVTTATTAGAPFVLVGAPGDYVFGGEGLDAVVTQLLGQLENSGPPPLPQEEIQTIATEQITATHLNANMACSICWDNFTLGETVSRLECEHIFHPQCITPWLQLHATCPICRRSLLPEPATAAAATSNSSTSSSTTVHAEPRDTALGGFSRVVVRRVVPRRRRSTQAPPTAPMSTSGSSSSGRGRWSTLTSQLASTADSASHSASSLGSDYMDIDFD